MKPILLFLVILYACGNSNEVAEGNNVDSRLTLDSLYESKEIVLFNRYGIGCNSVSFREKSCTFFFTDMCAYKFECVLASDRLNVLWKYETDCAIGYSLDSINRVYGYPQKNEIFGSFHLKSDSVLLFIPSNKDSLNLFNSSLIECDTLFPFQWVR
jgi:hypothetical protein